LKFGLGGRFDATNVITPELSVITSVSYDHQQYLGYTLTKIASEKAGIIKKAFPVWLVSEIIQFLKLSRKMPGKRSSSDQGVQPGPETDLPVNTGRLSIYL